MVSDEHPLAQADMFVGEGGHLVAQLAAAVRRLQETEAIVRDLAALECPVSTIVSEVMGDVDGLCPTCAATLSSESCPHLIEPHEPDCVYQRAVEWVQAH